MKGCDAFAVVFEDNVVNWAHHPFLDWLEAVGHREVFHAVAFPAHLRLHDDHLGEERPEAFGLFAENLATDKKASKTAIYV